MCAVLMAENREWANSSLDSIKNVRGSIDSNIRSRTSLIAIANIR